MSDVLVHNLTPLFPKLRSFSSTRALRGSEIFRGVEPDLRRVLDAVVTYQAPPIRSAVPRTFWRAVAWNIERGLHLDAVIETLATHAELAGADLYFLTELDFGMARTENRDVPGEIAARLGLGGAFVPCYLNLDKGSGLEQHASGENRYGLHGVR